MENFDEMTVNYDTEDRIERSKMFAVEFSKNPWQKLPHDIYKKHMGHENVQQIEMLSRIVGEQLLLVESINNPIIAIPGITSGNGLSNIKQGQYKTIIGIDINDEYLELCKKQYGYLSELVLYKIDLMTEKDRAAEVLKQADLIIANLLVKHIHLNNFIDIIKKSKNSIISITIQFNPDGQVVSNSGYEDAFNEIILHGEDSNESSLNSAMCEAGYFLTGRTEYLLPNKKIFIRLDYKIRVK